jgi:hypothetical protein
LKSFTTDSSSYIEKKPGLTRVDSVDLKELVRNPGKAVELLRFLAEPGLEHFI